MSWFAERSEPGDAPQHGGRVQLAATASVGGAVTRLTIAGVDVATILTLNPRAPPPFEGVHVWPQPQGRVVRPSGVPVDDGTPVRLFVLAGSPSVRPDVAVALHH